VGLVRAAVPLDAQAAVEVVRRSIVELCVPDHRNDAETLAQWLGNKTIEQFVAWFASERHYCAVAEDDSGICAVGLVENDGEIQLCYVLPGRQMKGFGTAILASLEAQAKRWGLTRVRLKSTGPARAFYERHGYRSAGEPGGGFGITRPLPYAKDLAR
jgi:GNAT superfamily N-acetyltransferase